MVGNPIWGQAESSGLASIVPRHKFFCLPIDNLRYAIAKYLKFSAVHLPD
jgi:hypothetical protein